jgi:acyl carrier protein
MKNETKFLEIIADILEVEVSEVSLTTELSQAQWDSLAVVTFISEIDSEFDVVVAPQKVAEVSKVQELFDLI